MDECHYIKNKNSIRSRSAVNLKGNIKWGLTGTPVQNSINDLITLMMFIKPNNWDLKKHPITKNSIKHYKNKLILRRTKDNHTWDVKNPLKISTISDKVVSFPFSTNEERQLYKVTIDNISEKISETLADDSGGNIGKFQCVFELLTRARQLSIHPKVYLDGIKRRAQRLDTIYKPYSKEEEDYDYNKISSRYEKVLEYIEEKRNTNQLVFCRFRTEMDLWEKILTKKGIRCCKYNGSTSLSERERIVNSFTTENPGGVLLIQIMAGGVGLNLQQFTRVFLTTPDWNPANEIQAIARSHRIGQSLPVEIFRFIMEDPEYENTIDKRIVNVQNKKYNIMNDILNDNLSDTKSRLSFDEIKAIIST